jgi:hypothetical protein
MSRASANAVVVPLYRALARLGRSCDRDPAIKALLHAQSSRSYDHEAEAWTPTQVRSERGLQSLAVRFLGGELYRPESSLRQFVADRFREPVTRPEQLSDRLDAAFAALAHLNTHVAGSQELPRAPPTADDAPFGELSAAEQAAEGSLLVSHPMQLQPSFGRAVLVVCRHGGGGAVGFVVNKPSPLRLADLPKHIDGLAADALGSLAANTVHVGGPVT